MKVLQINAVYGTGSTGRIVAEINDDLRRTGHSSIIATSQSTGASDETYIIGTKVGRKIHALLSRFSGKQAYFSTCATKQLIKWIEKEKPDIIHLHNLHANYINLGLLLNYIKKKNISTVITLHDCWFFTGKCTHYTEHGCYKWQEGCYDCSQLKKDNTSWFFDRTEKLWKEKKMWFKQLPNLAVIGVSDWITNEAKKSFLKDATIVKRIYNWIDLDIFYPIEDGTKDKYNLPKDKFLILCISAGWSESSTKYKDLIELSERLGAEERIVLIGNISESIKLPNNIIHLGYISDTNELAKVYSCVDAYVHLSHEDTFGKVIAEAMACGTPAIVYNATACPELIGENCGYVVEKGNIDGIIAAILKIKEKGKNSFSSSCVQFVNENFEKNKLIEETKEVYVQLLEENKE